MKRPNKRKSLTPRAIADRFGLTRQAVYVSIAKHGLAKTLAIYRARYGKVGKR